MNTEAKEILKAAKTAETEALKAAMPPKWFGFAISVAVGIIVCANGAGNAELSSLGIIAIALIIAVQYNKSKAMPKMAPANKYGYFPLIGFIAFILVITALTRYTTSVMELSWTPYASGLFVACITFYLSVSERKEYQDRINEADHNE
ncbi:hypothetical protein [Pseudemcibacter aquimaris]|uniref:hypothetical protein n=1 Tax=Pseudemcibacter aquimaris TaxID=2857064 RepID=UPI0020122F6A|nr:hypothetical protein [Pseudemcibacter aquimaris]MCC3859596.1 hypothetical protein [Pseudemcibacter aquimaris]WDU59992.1 hypothetical protein KW060_06945 [Pseudemcibacter aquimaris]